jgi:hypothetical protein
MLAGDGLGIVRGSCPRAAAALHLFLESTSGGRFLASALRLEAFCDHPSDSVLGELFIPPGQRLAMQVRETLRIGRQRFHFGLQPAPIINLYRGATDVKPMRRESIADHDAALRSAPKCI